MNGRFTHVVNVVGINDPTIPHCQMFRHAFALQVLLVELMTIAHTIFCKQIGEPLNRCVLNWVILLKYIMTGD